MLAGKPGISLEHCFQDCPVNGKTPALGKPQRSVRHTRFDADHGARGVAGSQNLTRVEINALAFQPDDLGVSEYPRHEGVEGVDTIDVPMDNLCQVALVKDTFLPADDVEHDSGIAFNLAG